MVLDLLAHRTLTAYPQRVASSTWLSHVPFGMLLIEMTKPRILVELGTYTGVSYCAFCQAVHELRLDSRCYAVDTWQGDPQTGHYESQVLDDLRAYHEPLYGRFSRLLQSSFDDARAHFDDGTVDLLHIDGLHTYDAVKHDFEYWLPKVSRQGIVLFHDTNVREKEFGVWKYWAEISEQYPHFELLHGHGLGLLAVGPDSLDLVVDLIRASEEEQVNLRSMFAQLGLRLDLAREVSELEVRMADQAQLLERLDEFEHVKRFLIVRLLLALRRYGFREAIGRGLRGLWQAISNGSNMSGAD